MKIPRVSYPLVALGATLRTVGGSLARTMHEMASSTLVSSLSLAEALGQAPPGIRGYGISGLLAIFV